MIIGLNLYYDMSVVILVAMLAYLSEQPDFSRLVIYFSVGWKPH